MYFTLSAAAFAIVMVSTTLLLTRYRINRRTADDSALFPDHKLSPTPTSSSKLPALSEKDGGANYVSHLQVFLRQIAYRYDAPAPPNRDFLDAFHEWFHFTLGPTSGWSAKKLDALEDVGSAIVERSYPYADTEVKMVMAKLSAIAILIDDSADNDEMYGQIERFAHRIYLGEPQPPGILRLYHESMMELSRLHEGDAVLRGLAVIPWITFVDACLLEKRLLTEDPTMRASPLDMGYERLLMNRCNATLSSTSSRRSLQNSIDANSNTKMMGNHGPRLTPLTAEAVKFPHYLRYKTGVGEAYAAAIFKANKDQELPLTRYIKALPDMSFFIEVVNDLMSFHKEELAGETSNLVHLRTQVLRSIPSCEGTGPSGEWTVSDTIRMLCDEVRDATFRIDRLLHLEENEIRERQKQGVEDVEVDRDVDITIAKQWRAFRDGYISWHLESRRYDLDFLRPRKFYRHK